MVESFPISIFPVFINFLAVPAPSFLSRSMSPSNFVRSATSSLSATVLPSYDPFNSHSELLSAQSTQFSSSYGLYACENLTVTLSCPIYGRLAPAVSSSSSRSSGQHVDIAPDTLPSNARKTLRKNVSSLRRCFRLAYIHAGLLVVEPINQIAKRYTM